MDNARARRSLHEAGNEQNIANALGEISRVLKPKGVINVLDAFVRFRLNRSVLLALRKIIKIEEHSYTREFESAMRNNGFVITRKSRIAWSSISKSALFVSRNKDAQLKRALSTS